MNAVKLLREQLKSAHEVMEGTMADVDTPIAHFRKINKAMPVGAAYAHCLIGEDMIVSMMLVHKTPLALSSSAIGVSELMPSMDKWDKHEKWYQSVEVDLPKLRTYAKKVYKATDDYLKTLKDKDLDKVVDVPNMGKQNLGWLISNYIILHIANLTGEVSAIKGVQGHKGYPF